VVLGSWAEEEGVEVASLSSRLEETGAQVELPSLQAFLPRPQPLEEGVGGWHGWREEAEACWREASPGESAGWRVVAGSKA